MPVDQNLHRLADLFLQRNITYGDSYANFGEILQHYFGTMTISSSKEWGRLAVLILLLGKMDRYTRNFERGGHADSLDDVSVYAQMLQDLDRRTR